jgi:cupin superfamily acireductone dioxygenase involved in methionine salvage
MKKFLVYSSGVTAFAIVFGILSVYGFFDISDGRAQLIGPSRTIQTEVDIHNQIVDNVHSIGINMRELNGTFSEFETTSDINILKEQVKLIESKRKSLEDHVKKNSFKRNKQTIEDTFAKQYLPTVISYENNFNKLFAYTSAKPLDEISLNSFKASAEKTLSNYTQAHNLFVDELNRVRRY